MEGLMMLTNEMIAHQRLGNQLLSRQAFQTPGAVVAWMGAVQAQEYPGSLWAVGLRVPGAVQADIEQAIADRTIVRTWPMRGTLHFVAAQDVRWMQALLAPRVRRLIDNAVRYNGFACDEATFARSQEVLVAALQGGKQLTRIELGAALERAGFDAKRIPFFLLMDRAMGDGLVCFGVKRGKQPTLALLDEWAPPARMLDREEALAELAGRYFTSHGPATLQDFVWWSGLTSADARAGIEMSASGLDREEVDGRTFWLSPSGLSAADARSGAYLLPAYDEYTVAYKDRSAVLDPRDFQRARNGIFSSVILRDGRIAGLWKRTIKKDAVIIETELLKPLGEAEHQEVTAAAQRYADFIGLPMQLGL